MKRNAAEIAGFLWSVIAVVVLLLVAFAYGTVVLAAIRHGGWLLPWGIAYFAIGAAFAYGMAISPRAVVLILVSWPLFAVMIALAPILNWYINRRYSSDD